MRQTLSVLLKGYVKPDIIHTCVSNNLINRYFTSHYKSHYLFHVQNYRPLFKNTLLQQLLRTLPTHQLFMQAHLKLQKYKLRDNKIRNVEYVSFSDNKKESYEYSKWQVTSVYYIVTYCPPYIT